MQLYYSKVGNFGDDLNPWLWPRLIPDVLATEPDVLFVGIGTILNHKLPAVSRKIVFGAGYGYGELPRIDDRFEIYFVRGPRTARLLHLEPRLAITDGAILLGALPAPPHAAADAAPRVAFMPHHGGAARADWARACAMAGIDYIDPRLDVDSVLARMRRASLLLAEAMHGAIVADALRIPWIVADCYGELDAGKWEDWTLSMDVRFDPQRVPAVWDPEGTRSVAGRARRAARRLLAGLHLGPERWRRGAFRRSGDADYMRASECLAALAASTARAQLSADRVHASRLAQVQEQVAALRRRHGMP
jgi:succinoglycan biosynthesis protein ExoV